MFSSLSRSHKYADAISCTLKSLAPDDCCMLKYQIMFLFSIGSIEIRMFLKIFSSKGRKGRQIELPKPRKTSSCNLIKRVCLSVGYILFMM